MFMFQFIMILWWEVKIGMSGCAWSCLRLKHLITLLLCFAGRQSCWTDISSVGWRTGWRKTHRWKYTASLLSGRETVAMARRKFSTRRYFLWTPPPMKVPPVRREISIDWTAPLFILFSDFVHLWSAGMLFRSCVGSPDWHRPLPRVHMRSGWHYEYVKRFPSSTRSSEGCLLVGLKWMRVLLFRPVASFIVITYFLSAISKLTLTRAIP